MYIFGQPVLRKQAEDITADYPDLQTLISNMFETLRAADGVGLAAPQIGLPIRVVVVDLDCLSEDEPQYKGFLRPYINGHIVEQSEEKSDFEEGCLSLPGIHEKVRRPSRVRVQYMDADFQPHDEWVEGMEARVLQHEFDHLEGQLFIDHVSPLRKQMMKRRLQAMAKGKYNCSYKTKTRH